MKAHASALVAPEADIADDVEIGPFCLVGAGVRLAPGVRLRSHVVIEGETSLGAGCEVHPFAVLGAAPQHAAYKPADPVRLQVGARCLIREHVTLHGGSVVGRGVTTIGDDCGFYVGSHVGHDCRVGDHVTMANGAVLGGHAVIGDHVFLGGGSAVQQRCRVGRHAFIGGLAGANLDVIPFAMVWGNHARLEGLNLIGLKRRGFSRATITTLRHAYQALFGCADLRPFRERVEASASAFGDSPEAMEIIDFIRAEPTRPLILPAREKHETE